MRWGHQFVSPASYRWGEIGCQPKIRPSQYIAFFDHNTLSFAAPRWDADRGWMTDNSFVFEMVSGRSLLRQLEEPSLKYR